MDYYELDTYEMPDYDMYEPTTAEIWTTCGWASLQQILTYYCVPFVFWNIAFRVTTQTCNYEHLQEEIHIHLELFSCFV